MPSDADGASAAAGSDRLSTSLSELVRQRFSCRCYEARRPVPRDLLVRCVEAARLAPSACNRQPWRFVIVDDPEMCRRFYAEGRRTGVAHEWWRDVPVFAVLCAERDFVTHRLAASISRIDYPLLDIGIAGEHFVLAATAAGLGTCWIGWFSDRGVRRIIGLPRRTKIVALITVGFPAEAPQTPRPRHDLGTILSWNGIQERQT